MFLLLITTSFSASASEPKRVVYPNLDRRIKFQIGHIFGQSKGLVSNVEKTELSLSDRFKMKELRLQFLAKYIFLDGKSENCKIREVLELDYKETGYPETKVCSSESKFPDELARFPSISMSIPITTDYELTEKGNVFIETSGFVSAHGVQVPAVFSVSLEKSENYRTRTFISTKLNYKDFDLKIRKPILFSINEEIAVDLNFEF